MKIIKGNKQYPLITGNDVIVTKGIKSLKTVDDVLDEQQEEIDSLKSNMKYIYSYGGVGGTGSGNSGGGSSTTEKEASIVVLLNNHQLQNEGSAIVLGSPGKYTFQVNVRNSNGNTYYIKYTYSGITSSVIPLSTSLNMCTYSVSLDLQTNSSINVIFMDSDGGILDSITQSYIVNPHVFNVNFKYISGSDKKTENTFSNNEYFIGSKNQLNPFVDISFKIAISNVTNVKVEYSIGDTDQTDDEKTNGQGYVSYGTTTDISNNHLKIYLENLKRNGSDFLIEENLGNYEVNVILSYTVDGSEVTESSSFTFTLIPSGLYINVRSSQNVLYNSLEDLIDAINVGKNGVPEKYVSIGSYSSFYVKVYEDAIQSTRWQYTVKCDTYDILDSSESDSEYEFSTKYNFEDSITVDEQIESSTPFYIPFDTKGIKKIVFKTNNTKNTNNTENRPTVKYVYVKESDSDRKWYPEQDIDNTCFYFKANCGSDTYSDNFPELSSGNQPLELKISDKSSLTLVNNTWRTLPNGTDTTILSLGIQYSEINSDESKILDVYGTIGDYNYTTNPEITLYSDKIFSTSGEIRIPSTSDYNKSTTNQYHLVQIVRTEIEKDVYESYLYVDGIPESVKTSTDSNNWYIGKIVLNNINVSYNLIEIQYINRQSKHTIDELIYRYNLKYKEKMKLETVSESEDTILNQINNHNIVFDGTNVVMSDDSLIKSISPKMPIPTMMISYKGGDGTFSDNDISDFENVLFMGYPNGDTSFGTREIKLYWCDGLKENVTSELHEVTIPSIKSSNENTYLTGKWGLKLQGTSTMRNRIKNFSLSVETSSNDSGEKILVSPNYDEDDTTTFLPEYEWTIKADIADSAHANNTSIGKFVNRTCTTFATGQTYAKKTTSDYVKNTLEGFPVLLFFQIKSKVYYFGVYNFNMGRTSYYNLGYHTATDMDDMISHITSGSNGDGFCFSKSTGEIVKNLAIGEIQDNFPEFDCHQFDSTVLFDDGTSNYTKMFGKDSKITYGSDIALAKNTLTNFVKSVAEAGTYCFGKIGKVPVSSKDETTGKCIDRYSEINQVPDVKYQMKYDGNNISWEQFKDFGYDNISDPDMLYQCISDKLSGDEGAANNPKLDYTSASEYYTICMGFGLVDSVLKNMNIKSWNGTKCYIGFYDMDCALGEDNSGDETVSYLAATDYWHSEMSGGALKPVTIDWDYWNDNIGKGFDCKSSYLFAVVKYAQAILGNDMVLNNYPQEFWAKLRNGELSSADYFIETYFKSGIGSIPTYLASLDYKVKYLYKGTILDDRGNESEIKFLANCSAFHGSRVEKVRMWLKRRLHILDAMFNVQNSVIEIGNKIYVPKPDTDLINSLKNNSDVIILSDAFTSSNTNTILRSSKSVLVNIYAPMNTPFVMVNGGSSEVYLLSEGTGKPNPIIITYNQAAITAKFYGSKEFTDISMVEPLLTSAYQIVSNKLENITYGNTGFPVTTHEFTITSTSVKTIKLDIPIYNGKLTITNNGLYGKSINSLNVSGSGFYGEWDQLSSLSSLDISSVSSPNNTISVSNCKLLKGDNCNISGKSEDDLTSLQALTMSDVSGNFKLLNTSIETISMSAIDGEDATFEITGDSMLRTLSLTGFSSVKISGCKNISSLTISESDNNKCKTIIIDIPADYNSYDEYEPLLNSFNSSKEGVFDFTKYTELETLGVSGCYGAEVIKIPNHKVKVTTFQNNMNLEFVDTVGKNSVISLTGENTFYLCPKYGMYQSWHSEFGLNEMKITETTTETYKPTVRTKMCIDDNCTTLAHTFDRVQEISTKYTSTSPYVNEWGQKIYNTSIKNLDAVYFLNTVVAGNNLDDPYLDENNVIHDTAYTGNKFGNNCCKNIKSLQACFRHQKSITNTITSSSNIPDLSEYTSLVNINEMYSSTGITYLNKDLLSLPSELNNNDSDVITWEGFIKTGDLNISKDALSNISYRIESLNSLAFSVYDTSGKLYDSIDIKDILCIKKYEGDSEIEGLTTDGTYKYIPLTRLTSFTLFNINPVQSVDYTSIFSVCCPNVSSLSSFLSCDLSKAKIDGILKTCIKLQSITDSFNHSGSVEDDLTNSIDLYEFFNWGKNTGMTNLFTSSSNSLPGFSIKKTITFEHLKEIMSLLSEYQNMTRLSNLFSYCTITGYDKNYEIVIGDSSESDDDIMSKIVNVDALFYKCKALDFDNNKVPLNIKRSFFKKLPNVVSLANTFMGIKLCNMLSLDFFCKLRKVKKSDIYVYEDGKYIQATLNTYDYGTSHITTMYNCFKDVYFEGCKSWFDMSDNDNETLIQTKDVAVSNLTNKEYTDAYYTLYGGVYTKVDITEPNVVLDLQNNFTNYVDQITLPKGNLTFANHNIKGDRGTTNDNVYTENEFNIYPVHCCLPPDILFGCNNDCLLTGVFANTNIMGVIPQHLISKCYNSKSLKDMLLNTDILPNVIYHYNEFYTDEQKTKYLELIKDIPVDNTMITDDKYSLTGSTDDDAVVLFRDSNGTLKRRYPRSGNRLNRETDKINTDYSKSQFVYVPQNFTTNDNLDNAFTFRYNLPTNVVLKDSDLSDKGMYWGADSSSSSAGSYGTAYSPEEQPYLWPYYTQYFFLTSESVKWSKILSMTYPFISDDGDKDYSTNKSRVLSTNNYDDKDVNVWRTDEKSILSKESWKSNTEGIFNVFLNLCGSRDTKTGEMTDCGCRISDTLTNNNNPKLDSFVSGILGTFLNGRVFDDSTNAGVLSGLNTNGSKIVIFNGFGRNIILPLLNTLLSKDKDGKYVLDYSEDSSLFYKFMFGNDNSLNNYKERYFNNSSTILVDTDVKYIVNS